MFKKTHCQDYLPSDTRRLKSLSYGIKKLNAVFSHPDGYEYHVTIEPKLPQPAKEDIEKMLEDLNTWNPGK